MPRPGSSHRDQTGEGLLSIGALSTATGIPIDTIRTWERRYGVPVPVRKPSGHRVYPLATVPHLRRAAQAIARGHRAAEVLPASEGALEALLESLPATSAPPEARGMADTTADVDAAGFEELLEAVRRFDGERLKRILQSEWARRGPIDFLEHCAGPFLAEVGRGWAEGALEVRHEHFASGVLGDFLRTVRQPLDDRAAGPVAALATLPGELHGLGLQMAALVFALAGWQTLVLGVDTPIPQIAALARDAPLAAVGLSCVQERGRNGTVSVRALRRGLPRSVPLLIGGRAAPARTLLKGVYIIPDLTGLELWLKGQGVRR
jgi:DNA-binding transcriptional MerR regulator/methylmalonyl-CoA mutase cobalamin-binding subunit